MPTSLYKYFRLASVLLTVSACLSISTFLLVLLKLSYHFPNKLFQSLLGALLPLAMLSCQPEEVEPINQAALEQESVEKTNAVNARTLAAPKLWWHTFDDEGEYLGTKVRSDGGLRIGFNSYSSDLGNDIRVFEGLLFILPNGEVRLRFNPNGSAAPSPNANVLLYIHKKRSDGSWNIVYKDDESWGFVQGGGDIRTLFHTPKQKGQYRVEARIYSAFASEFGANRIVAGFRIK